jgi:hypothetical protein
VGVPEWLAIVGGVFWFVSAAASWRRAKGSFKSLSNDTSDLHVLRCVVQLRRVSRGKAATQRQFRFGQQKPELPDRNAAADVYASLTNAAAAFFAFAAAVAFAVAASCDCAS